MTMPRPLRWISADDVVSGRINMDAYPFRYFRLKVVHWGPDGGLDILLTAVEMLETRGWELVAFVDRSDQDRMLTAYMRRVAPVAPRA